MGIIPKSTKKAIEKQFHKIRQNITKTQPEQHAIQAFRQKVRNKRSLSKTKLGERILIPQQIKQITTILINSLVKHTEKRSINVQKITEQLIHAHTHKP